MKGAPFFSIITPACDHARFIGACIESVLAQTWSDWEMIVIDDASQDRTAALVQGYMRHEPRIRLLRHDARLGLAALHQTYNQGLQAAAGRWIAILEGDDAWPADKLARQREHCRSGQAVVCFGACLLLSPAGEVIADVQRGLPPSFRRYFRDYLGPCTRPLLLRPGFIHPVTVVIDRQALERIGGFQHAPGLHLTDYPTLLELSRLGPFYGARQRLGFYRRHEESQSLVQIVELTAQEKKLAFAFFEKSGAAGPGAARFARSMKRSWAGEVAGSFWVQGRRLLAGGDAGAARNAFSRGLRGEMPCVRPGWRVLKAKALCLLGLLCVAAGVDLERLVAAATRRRRSLLQEALAEIKK
jgi:glycosyltransferase involved in cell wall biosynthesis